MASFEHTNTFLRSALVKDPFCLGDLGPEDVLRIESEFPNLFSSRSQRIPERKTLRPADGSPYAVPLISRTSATGPARPGNSRNGRGNLRGTCSRGAPRCYPRPNSSGTTDGNITDPVTLTKPGIWNSMPKPVPQVQFSAFGGSVVKHVSRLQNKNPVHEPSDSDLLLNRYKEELSTSRRKLEEVTLALKEKQFQVSNRLSQHKIGDSKSISSSIPLHGARLLEMASIKKPKGKYQFPEQFHEVKKQTQSMPKLSTKNSSPPQDGVKKAGSADLPRRKQVKFETVEPDRDILKQHSKKLLAKARNAPGFIRPTFSNSGIMKANLKSKMSRKQSTKTEQSLVSVGKSHARAAASTDDTKINDSPPASPHIPGIDEETEPTLVSPSISEDEEDLTTASETPLWYSPLQIHNRKTSEEMSAEIVDLQKLQTESTAKFEQLLFAKLLASRYENEGKFQKSQMLSQQEPVEIPPISSQFERTTQRSQRHTDQVKYRKQPPRPKIPSQVSLEQKSVLEKIAAELIRAEVLKCIHTEELNATVDIGVGTGSPISCDTPVNSKDNSHKLSTISEEVIPTPDLTPPRAASRIGAEQPNIQDIIDDLQAEILRTPEITPPLKREVQITKPVRADNFNKTSQENCNDLTDCSSISDFVFSEIVATAATNKRNLMNVNPLAVLPDMKTPSITPPLENTEEDENVDVISASATRTPAPSTSASAVRFTLPHSVDRQRSASAHSSSSRETKTSARRTSPRSRLDNLDQRSIHSKTDLTSEQEQSQSSAGLSSGFRQIYTEMVSDGEFLGVPYKSPGEVSWSLSLSPGRYLDKEDDTQSSYSIDSKDTFSEDLLGTEASEGELRSRK